MDLYPAADNPDPLDDTVNGHPDSPRTIQGAEDKRLRGPQLMHGILR